MKTRVQKWGNSLALRIPQAFARESGIDENSSVDVSLKNGKLIVVPLQEEDASLEDLVSAISAENLHSEVKTGSRRGNEAW